MLAFMKKMEILKPVPSKYNKVKVGDKYDITPMDLQVLIPKATEVGRNQQINDQQLTNSQGIVTEDFKKMTQHKQKQVEDMNKSKGNVIKDGQERNKNKQQSSSKGQLQEAEENEVDTVKFAVDSNRGKHIDIRT